jgi:hypothetical protein
MGRTDPAAPCGNSLSAPADDSLEPARTGDAGALTRSDEPPDGPGTDEAAVDPAARWPRALLEDLEYMADHIAAQDSESDLDVNFGLWRHAWLRSVPRGDD